MLSFNNTSSRLMVGVISSFLAMASIALIVWSWSMTRATITYIIPGSDVLILNTSSEMANFFLTPANSLAVLIQFGQTVCWALAVVLRYQNNGKNAILSMRIGLAFVAVDLLTDIIQLVSNFLEARSDATAVMTIVVVIIIIMGSLILTQMEELFLACVTIIVFVVAVTLGLKQRGMQGIADSFSADLAAALGR